MFPDTPETTRADEGGPTRPVAGAPGVCVSCQRPLVRRGPAGECLRCLFGLGFSPAEEAADVPRRYGHFEIARQADGSPQELGSGAMGTTYRARDTVLGSAVALKVIARRFADQPDARTRFLREARAAARLRHPNVARVFHYGEQDGECFYAMELVEGETLEARVRRDGPLPAALALEVAAQVARALVAAEAQGIVHRDLKPANVMLVAGEPDARGREPAPLVKVIDFGLAKAVPGAGAGSLGLGDTERGAFVGTPAFAGPERFSPDDDAGAGGGHVDTRTDIYALGVTLWFLLCGRVPFAGETLDEIRAQQTREPLPAAQLRAARVPAPVAALLKTMLAARPAERPGSARELLDALHRVQLQAAHAARARWVRRAAGLGLAAAAILAVALWREHTRPPAAPPDRSLAVLPFENLSPDPADAFFTTGIQDQITVDLGRVAALQVTGSESARFYPPGPSRRNLPAIGRELGVRYLLEGSARRAGDQLSVAVRLTDLRAEPGVAFWTGQYRRRLADVFVVQGEITRAVAARLQAPLSAEERAAINRPPTSDLAAYDLYLRAAEISRRVGSDGPGEQMIREARQEIALLEQAVARDPTFALAYCELARAHDQIHHNRYAAPSDSEESRVDHRARAEAALAKARRLQPDAGEVHLAHAVHALQINNDVEQARYEIDLARRALPNTVTVEVVAGRVARRQDRWEEAVRALEHAVALEPRNQDAWDVLSVTFYYLRRYDEAERALNRLIALTPAGETPEMLVARAQFAASRRADLGPWRAEVLAQSAVGALDDEGRERSEILLAFFGRDAAGLTRAVAAGRQLGCSNAGVIYPPAWYEAVAARLRGDDPGARAAFAAARPALERQVLSDPTQGKPLSVLAIVDAGLGRREDAVREAKLACELSTFERAVLDAPIVRCNLAVVYAWTGQPDLALAELEPLVNRPCGNLALPQPTYGDFRLNPLWDPLRADPRFEALVRRLAPTTSP